MLTFRAGDPERPRGHAFLFFRDADDPDGVLATYLVVAPISLDLSKYLPPALAGGLAGQLGSLGMGAEHAGAYPLPPIPEKMEGGLAGLERLANLRGDDLLDGGTVRAGDPFQLMRAVMEFGREYGQQCQRYVESAPGEPAELASSGAALPGVDVDDLLLQVMPDREKIGRLARLVGTLRYAVEGGDQGLAADTAAEMERVGRRLGEKYRVAELIVAARSREPNSGQLAQLYVERCYRLADEDYAAVPNLDQRIAELRSGLADQP